MEKPQKNLKNIKAYLQGKIRYKLYYSWAYWLIPLYIREQIRMRIQYMLPECYSGGQCIHCGCETTALQMANKSCDEPCYPPMMTRSQWKEFIQFRNTMFFGDFSWSYSAITKTITRWDIKNQRSTVLKRFDHV